MPSSAKWVLDKRGPSFIFKMFLYIFIKYPMLFSGTYVFARDIRHNYRNSSVINLENGLQFIAKIKAETIHIL